MFHLVDSFAGGLFVGVVVVGVLGFVHFRAYGRGYQDGWEDKARLRKLP